MFYDLRLYRFRCQYRTTYATDVHRLKVIAVFAATRLSAVSPLYLSAPVGCVGSQPTYCNAVAELQTRQSPRFLHKRLRRLEKSVQRRRRRKNAPRFLDVDYLLHGTARLSSPDLTLPHPRIEKRAFVLRPLADIVGSDFLPDNGPHTQRRAF